MHMRVKECFVFDFYLFYDHIERHNINVIDIVHKTWTTTGTTQDE